VPDLSRQHGGTETSRTHRPATRRDIPEKRRNHSQRCEDAYPRIRFGRGLWRILKVSLFITRVTEAQPVRDVN